MFISDFRCRTCGDVAEKMFPSYTAYQARAVKRDIICVRCQGDDLVKVQGVAALDSTSLPYAGTKFREGQKVPFGKAIEKELGSSYSRKQAHKWARKNGMEPAG